jgi:response regulator of citrate/malate metabolism
VSRLKDAAIRHQWAAKEADLAYSDLIAECMKARNDGMSITKISQLSGISRMTLHKYASAALSANLRASQDD